jgi:cobalt-zinc-cadmium efflux system membrane fusion protein
MQNPGNLFRAGLFVTATVWLGGEEESVIIPASAVQQLQGMPVVFVPNGNAFKIREIKTGRRYRGHIAVTAGLKVGEMIVDKGSFELKAKQLTSGLDPHAGHGH